MIGNHEEKASNVWLVVKPDSPGGEFPYPQFAIELAGEGKLYSAVAEGDWLVVADASGDVTRFGRVLRIRSDLAKTTVYFDRLMTVVEGIALAAVGFALPETGSIRRLQWSDFVAASPKLTGGGLDDVPLICDQPYIRELLQLAVMDDLLGPANGPHEQIVGYGCPRQVSGRQTRAPRSRLMAESKDWKGHWPPKRRRSQGVSKFIMDVTSREPNSTARRAASMPKRIRLTKSMPPATSPLFLRASG